MSKGDTQPFIPVIGRCLVEPYAENHWNLANEAVARLLASRGAAVVEIDIRPDGLRTAAAIEALIARVDMLVTTRLHGLVLALKNGVPVVAIDPMGDGGEILRQASIIGWPVVFAADRLDEAGLQRAFDHCLTAEARNEATACADRARQSLSEIPGTFVVGSADPSPTPRARGAEPTGRPSGSLTATPASLQVVGLDSTGVTTLEWSSAGTDIVEVHVGAPDGPLLSRSGPSGKATTGQWVSDGLTFFLQDVTGGAPLTSDHTLAKTAVTVTSIESREGRPAVGHVQFGGLRRLTPISRQYGFDRGRPIDRHYIENFLARYAGDVRGRTLEIGDDTYTRRFGADRVTRRDVLHVSRDHPTATIVGDLASAEHIASDVFDCVILTQTLHLVFDVRAALATVHRILRPGGVLLATFPGLSQIADAEWKRSWYWGLTTLSARRLIAETFPRAEVQIESWGNVLAATAFLHGLADEELRTNELDYQDPQYELLITLRAAKAVIA
jgi:SAM-dependent methyltransferase